MKRLQLSGAMLGLTVLLTACPGTTTPPSPTLTVKLGGVSSAPVTVTNTTTKTQVFSGTVEGSKTFSNLKAGDVFKVEGGAVSGHTAPAAQTVTLDADKTVTLTYTAAQPPAATTHSLTVKLEGVASAPVTITNTTTTTQVFSGTLEGSKTFGDLKAGDVFKVEGGAVSGFTVPGAQTLTLDADRAATLEYRAIPLPGNAVTANVISGQIEGYTFGSGRAYLANAASVSMAEQGTISPTQQLSFELKARPDADSFYTILPPAGDICQFTGTSTSNPRIATFTGLLVRGVQGEGQEYLGKIQERIVSGASAENAVVARIYSMGAATVKGSVLCGNEFVIDYDLDLAAGWNAVELINDKPHVTLRNLNAGARTTLTFERAAESVHVLFQDYSSFTLRPGEKAQRDVTFRQTGGIGGAVTLETDVPGVTVTPSTLTLPALGTAGAGKNRLNAQSAVVRPQALSTSLTFSADQGAQGYDGPLNVIVKKGGQEVGRGMLYFSLRVPSVSLYIPEAYNAVKLYQGGTSGLEVSVGSVEGFSGSTTLTVEGLPTGVTAPPVTVQVTPGTTTTVTIPLTAAADAPLGGSTLTVTSPGAGTSLRSNPVPLSVLPSRALIGSVASSVTRGAEGLWVAGEGAYDPAASTSTTRLTRYVGTQAVTTVTVPVSYPRLLTLPGGDVLAVGSGANVYRVADTGTVTLLPNPVGDGLGDAAVDAQGRVWFVQRTSVSMGGSSSVLARWNPVTAEVVPVDSSRDYGYSGGRFSASNDGRILVYLPSYSTKALKIDSLAGTVSDLGADISAENGSVAISDSGAVWFTQYGALKRLNGDGSTTTFGGASVDRLTGFDRVDASTLWGAGYSGAARIDVSTGKVSNLFLGSVSAAVTPNGGGLNVVTSEYSGGSQQFSLSFLK